MRCIYKAFYLRGIKPGRRFGIAAFFPLSLTPTFAMWSSLMFLEDAESPG